MASTTFIFLPPLPRMSGGLAVLLHVGAHLFRAGFRVCFVQREAAALPEGMPPVPVLAWDELRLTPEHIWLVPEGWANALAPGLAAGARSVVYVQNWAFALGVLPPGTRWDQLPVDFIHVSEPVRWFMAEATGKDGPVLRPGVDTALFFPPVCEDRGAPVRGPLRVAWMPRKNKALAQQIRETVEQRLPRLYPELALEWVEIHHRSRGEVAELLRGAHIFLATGFPEGCPLPPLEAMASGCVVAGFSGLGGWDYMRQATGATGATWATGETGETGETGAMDALEEGGPAFWARPWWPLRPVPFGGNGFYAADADIPAAALALEAACLTLARGGPALAALRHNLALTAAAYTVQAQAEAVAELWKTFFNVTV